MWKKIIISIVVFIFCGIGIIAIFFFFLRDLENTNLENKIETKKIEEISEELVDDDCIAEWEEYEEYIKELEQASSMYQNEETHYLVKAEDNYIVVYYVDDGKNNILYKDTGISIDYLGEEDVRNLKNGIDVYGVESLNKLLEDFE